MFVVNYKSSFESPKQIRKDCLPFREKQNKTKQKRNFSGHGALCIVDVVYGQSPFLLREGDSEVSQGL